MIGGAWMGMSHALYETTEPYYPDRDHGRIDFNQYLMPGPGDLAEIRESSSSSVPSPDGPYGAKGPGEMSRQFADPGHRQRDLRRRRRAHRHAADHARKDTAGLMGAGPERPG